MLDFIIVGAGISGLSLAWHLGRRGARVHVVEARDQAGGTLRSLHTRGYLIEAGPNSTLDNNPEIGRLLRGCGLEGERIEAGPAARRRYVVKGGRLVALPDSPLGFARTRLFSTRAKLRLLGEAFIRRGRGEESIAAFVRRRLGPEFLDWAIDPFISGVYAGDPARLSVQAATPKIHALEARYGSLIRGAVARLVVQRQASGPAPRGHLISLRQGMQTLPERLAAALGGRLSLSSPVTGVEALEGHWRAHTQGSAALEARQLVLAVPAHVAAGLLRPMAPGLARELEAIHYPPVASVAIGLRREQVGHPLDGFGCLIPRREGIETLGAIFSSTLFPGRAPEGAVLLTCFLGGARNPGVAHYTEQSLVERVMADLRPLLGISGAPLMTRVSRWDRAIPQYELGHLGRLSRIDTRLQALPGLHLRANWRDGISVGDCIRNGAELAAALAPGRDNGTAGEPLDTRVQHLSEGT